jgi:hypothetical protein
MAMFSDEAGHAEHVDALERLPVWRRRLSHELDERLDGREAVVRLEPTARSQLHG